jgi:hypothetical protein
MSNSAMQVRAEFGRMRKSVQKGIPSLPGIAVQRTASLPLAFDPAIHRKDGYFLKR